MCSQNKQTSYRLLRLRGYRCDEIARMGYEIVVLLFITASRGTPLSLITVFFAFHWALHMHIAEPDYYRWSHPLLCATALLLMAGFWLLCALYRHSIHTIFNSKVPSNFLPSFAVHLEMLKPLEIIWRYMTFRLRVLPDIIVVGEVRCGTTTLCHHLASINGCHHPFCLWRHPELGNKETFYFVGHYLGCVDPQQYRMCFPLAITRFFHTRILRRPFFAFDGCAQFLSSPSAPYLIAMAYKRAGQPPPVIVACVRDPLRQTLSWWNYENNSISWGKSMGLIDWNDEIRTKAYPPENLSEAFAYSFSDEVNIMYRRAEDLFYGNDPICYRLPPWASTWPGGQMSGIGRNGCFAANIERYERVFSDVFGPSTYAQLLPESSMLKYVNVVPLENMNEPEGLFSILTSLATQINHRTCSGKLLATSDIRPGSEIHRNANKTKTNAEIITSSSELSCMLNLFASETRKLESMCGVGYCWKSSGSRSFDGIGPR